MSAKFQFLGWGVLSLVSWAPALAQSNAQLAAQVVQITATRFGEPIQEVPGSISVVTGESLRARGATDLRTALAMLGGVSVALGGDAGPASAVPSLLGVREVDDLLLLIDGIPAGGAFVPQVDAVSLVNVERIEVLRGAAPVYFGTTAFAGTLNVIHYAAGRADSSVSLRAGSRRALGISGAAVLSTGAVRQSISAEFSDDRVADTRAGYKRAQGSWRLASDVAGGSARADVNLLALRQKPNSPTPIDEETGQLITLLPKDFNQNPSDAKLNTDRAQLVLGYDLPLSFARWGSSLAFTNTRSDNVRAFIDPEDSPQPWTKDTVAALEANHQNRRLRELFVDSHLTSQPLPGWDLTTGINLLLGRAKVKSLRYAIEVPLDGNSAAPNIESVAPKTDVDLADSRRFLGLYAQSRFKLSDSASVLAGLRWNSTKESRTETRISLASGDVVATDDSQSINRLSGSLGAQWKVFNSTQGALNGLTLHTSMGSTFQPAQLDFNPNPEPKAEAGGLLKPETQRSLIAGFKVDALDGMLDFDIDGFLVDFNNQPVVVTVGENTALRSVGQQRYKGIDIEGTWRPTADWMLKASATWSDARYRDFVTNIAGEPTQLAGKRQVLTPSWRAGAGVVYAPELGWRGSLTTSFTGTHWLDRLNEHQAPGYTLVDASLGYRFESFTVQVSGTNLGNRRDAAQMSELGEGQFYRLPARHVDVTLTVPLR
jgi:iron complex outermembrane recepter protein